MRNIKKYEDVTDEKINSQINEELDQSSINDCIDLLEEAKMQMEEALQNLKGVYRKLQGTEMSTAAERLKVYIIGHLEPMISSDHEWLTRSISIDEIIEELRESGFDSENIEEE